MGCVENPVDEVITRGRILLNPTKLVRTGRASAGEPCPLLTKAPGTSGRGTTTQGGPRTSEVGNRVPLDVQ